MGSESSPGTTQGTFRIPDDLYKAFQREAREKNTSLNTLLNQILRDHFGAEPPLMKPNFLALSRTTYKALLSKLSEADARDVGRRVSGEVIGSLVLARHGEITVDGIVEIVRDFCDRGGFGEFSYMTEGGKRIMGMLHDFGPNNSAMGAGCWEALFQAAGVHPKIKTTNDAIIAEF